MRQFPARYYLQDNIIGDNVGKIGEFSPSLLFQQPNLLALVNEWLGRLKVDYKLEVARLTDRETEVEEGIFALRLRSRSTSVSSSLLDVGFGVSQLLPVVLQCLLSKGSTICIEQPEIHLHPALQAELGDLFIEAALGDQKNTLILETHSEHMILRILRRIRETANGEPSNGLQQVRPEDVQVIYAEPTANGTVLHDLPITTDGDFEKKWPQGFFTERRRELFSS